MSVKLQNANVPDIREKFYELLQNYPTFPAAQNYFLVKISNIPAAVNDADILSLGYRTGSNAGIEKAKNIHNTFFDGSDYTFLVTGVDLNAEKSDVIQQNQTYPSGLLPTGPYTRSHQHPDTDLDIQFSETNISIVDGVIRPWVQLYSSYGNLRLAGDPEIRADVDVFFLSKDVVKGSKKCFKSILFGSAGSSDPVIRKIYKYKDCIPYDITSANVAEYNGDVNYGSISTKWRFSRYEVNIPFN